MADSTGYIGGGFFLEAFLALLGLLLALMGSKMAPRWLQDASSCPTWPQVVQLGLKLLQFGLDMAQLGPSWTPNTPF